MFGQYSLDRTPVKRVSKSKADPGSNSPTDRPAGQNARRSVGEREPARVTSPTRRPPPTTVTTPSPKHMPTLATITVTKKKRAPIRCLEGELPSRLQISPTSPPKSRREEANSWFAKGHRALSESRNLRGDIKETLKAALSHLMRLFKEAEAGSSVEGGTEREESEGTGVTEQIGKDNPPPACSVSLENVRALMERVEENNRILKENRERLDLLVERPQLSYANAVRAESSKEPATLHSVIVTSKNEEDTGEEVLEKVRKTIDAKNGWVKVERVRKARDRKIVLGCKTKEEREKVISKLKDSGGQLVAEEVKNKDPLLVLRDVLTVHSDVEVLGALRSQNAGVFGALADEEDRMEVKYRRKARNPHNANIVLRVSPTIWARAVAAGRLKVDLQNVRVEDQSPLVQCTRCLAYGHSKRLCREPADLCSHCGGPHMRDKCADMAAGEPPACRNCARAGAAHVQHNAFSAECPVRRKWDALARASVAYC
ncbi:uncharacterized protein LOC142984917 [Anticarsia gemmatalis]|uniref:uncharacterized protein LOC142984917 n=1 Tax=Anticarsia gemmatalis TaxID=129554 RepID=UPI003F7614F4